MLELRDYHVDIAGKSIIQSLDFTFENGRTYAILGPNGSGKSSLAFSLMGHKRYHTEGIMLCEGEDISMLRPHERSARGIFLSFQNIPEIPGISLFEYLKTIYTTHQVIRFPEAKAVTTTLFRRMLIKLLPDLDIDISFLERDLYVGFSGGEKRRIELLQIRLLDPEYIILDEVDAGLDIGAIEILISEIKRLHEKGKTIIIITHNFQLLSSVEVDRVLLLSRGILAESGSRDIINRIKQKGF